jgi:hypothetical protein
MKLFLFVAMALPFLLVTKTAAQSDLKEKLKVLESTINESQSTTQAALQNPTSPVDFEWQLSITLDRLIAFVVLQKTIKDAAFEANVTPFIEENVLPFNTSSTDFTEEEEMIFDSFIKVLQWQEATKMVQLYQEFIIKNYEGISEMNSLKTVLSYIVSIQRYIVKQQLLEPNKNIALKINEEFEDYNSVHWRVFALQPRTMLLWVIASAVWDYHREK